MATFAENIKAFATQVGKDVKELKNKDTELSTQAGNLTELTTTDKTSLVKAINEVKSISVAGGATTAYVDNKVTEEINKLVNGAPEALDTLKEIADKLTAGDSVTVALTAQVNNRVKYNEDQTLTTTQQAQACKNIGIGDPATNFLAAYTTARDN